MEIISANPSLSARAISERMSETVADRLYKIRNSLNIEGVKRTLALFAPPIDPGMLENYEREIELKDEMYEHLSEKYTNKDLYTWLKYSGLKI